uniref:CH-like domain-containing protein n=1 Tax=Loxodonta africana TaxID=9785 RepID=G3UIU7_LOXAF
ALSGPSPGNGPNNAPAPCYLRSLYAWLDRLPLSRPKRHLARHFGDGVMMAKIVKYFHPQLVDLHNYVPTCNTDQKLSNWSTFNRKVFHKLCFCISEADICKVVANMPGAMEPILCALRAKVEEGALGGSPASKAGQRPPGPSADGPWAELAGHRYPPGRKSADGRGRQSPRILGGGLQPLPQPPGTRAPPLRLPSRQRLLEPSSPLVLWGRKTPPTQWPLENMGCTCPSQDMAGWPWEAPDHGVQQLLEVKEQALAILQETVKILQMKVARLEQLVKLKDLRIRELAGHAGIPASHRQSRRTHPLKLEPKY